MEYVKINSLWRREQYQEGLPKGSHGKLKQGEYSEPEFGNIRIMYQNGNVEFGGRTDAAQIPCHLLKYLQDTFIPFVLEKAFRVDAAVPYPSVILYGEGYGPKIQACGGNYRKDPSFRLFDCRINGWWLQREDVYEIAQKMRIDHCPDLGIMMEEEIIDFVKSKPLSRCSEVPQMMEGVICRSEPLMLFRNGKPLMWKLKCKEFV